MFAGLNRNLGRYYNILRKQCYNNSLAASFLAFSARVIHSVFKLYHQKIDVFISPSQFLKDKIISYRIEESKIMVISHLIDLGNDEPNYNFDDYVVFAGRFIRYKGIMTLIKAFEGLPIKLIVVGSGELQPEIQNFIKMHNLENIELSGFITGERFKNIIKNAKFVIIPSEWYENSPLVVYESFAMCKPVIASNIGGIPELVTEDVGLLFEPGNIGDLRKKITTLYYNDELIRKLGKNARTKVENFYNPEIHYKQIIKVYRRLVDGRN